MRRLITLIAFCLIALPARATDFAFTFREHIDVIDDFPFTVADQVFAYPHTYRTTAGQTVIGGWENSGSGTCLNGVATRERTVVGDPRLTGLAGQTGGNSSPNTFQCVFRIDLTATGNWAITFAGSDISFGPINEYIAFKDGGTAFATYTNLNVDTGHFMDATGAVVTTANWPLTNTPLQHTFTSTTFEIFVGPDSPTGTLGSIMSFIRLTSGVFPTTPKIKPTSHINGQTVVNQGQTLQFTAQDAGTWSCTATDSSGGATACLGSINSGTGLYTAPATVTAQHSLGGFQLLPNNHIFNTRVDALPVHASSGTWQSVVNVGGSPSYSIDFPINYVLPSAPSSPHMFYFYTHYLDNEPMELPAFPDARIESGWIRAINMVAFNGDHHLQIVDTQTGRFEEMYQFYNPGNNGSCLLCTSQSAALYTNFSYTLPGGRINGTGSTTDAAGLSLMPLQLGLQEIEQAVATSGSINHALRATFGIGFECTCFLWPAMQTATDGATLPFGARARLKSTFDISSYSATAKILLTQLKNYGLINADGGNNWPMSTQYTRWPPTYLTAFTAVANAGVNFTITNTALTSNVCTVTAANDFVANQTRVVVSGTTNGGGACNATKEVTSASGTQFTYAVTHADVTSAADTGTAFSPLSNYMEWVDESSLMINAWDGRTTNNRETVVFTRTSDSATNSADILLTGVAVNLPNDFLYIQAGTPAQQLAAFVNVGAVTWSMSPSVGTLTSGGLYTAPASVGSPTTTVITATSTTNGSVAAQMNVTVFPTGPIRLLPSNSVNYTDSTGHVWNHQTGVDIPDTIGCCAFDNYGGFPNITDKTLWTSQVYNFAEIHSSFLVPNGNYTITYHWGVTNGSVSTDTELDAQGNILLDHGNMVALAGGTLLPYTFNSGNIVVSNNKLSFNMRDYANSGGVGRVSSFSITQVALPPGTTIAPGMKWAAGTVIH